MITSVNIIIKNRYDRQVNADTGRTVSSRNASRNEVRNFSDSIWRKYGGMRKSQLKNCLSSSILFDCTMKNSF